MKNWPCKKCAEKQKTCCQEPFENSEKEDATGVVLTLHDVVRIVRETGMDPEGFCEIVPLNEAHEDVAEDDELFKKSFFDGKVLSLKAKANQCFFLGGDGCKIFNARPNICMAFPFDFKIGVDGKFEIAYCCDETIEEETCPVSKKFFGKFDEDKIFEELGESREEFKKMLERHYMELLYFEKLKNEIKNMKDVKRLIKPLLKQA